jgi:hypothetical protein
MVVIRPSGRIPVLQSCFYLLDRIKDLIPLHFCRLILYHHNSDIPIDSKRHIKDSQPNKTLKKNNAKCHHPLS